MKKYLSFIVMSLVALLPFTVDAATISAEPNCKKPDAEGNIVCTIGYEIADAATTPVESLIIKLTEGGGAQIVSVSDVSGSAWESTSTEAGNVWTVTLISPGVTNGEGDLFTFTYKKSGQADCKVLMELEGKTKEIIPEDVPTENKDTGATLPYIALGFVALAATGAYLATKNKSKMYKI